MPEVLASGLDGVWGLALCAPPDSAPLAPETREAQRLWGGVGWKPKM